LKSKFFTKQTSKMNFRISSKKPHAWSWGAQFHFQEKAEKKVENACSETRAPSDAYFGYFFFLERRSELSQVKADQNQPIKICAMLGDAL